MMANIQDDGRGSFPPWSRIQSLNEMTADAGIDFDQFIKSLAEGQSTAEMAELFGVSEAAVISLNEHFIKYGISSVMGGD